MRTVFYVDVYFILNFIVNLFLICLTAAFRQKKCHFRKLVFLSAFFALLSVLLYFFFYGKLWILAGSVPFQILLFLYLGFWQERWQDLMKDFFTFLLLTCLSGGVITAVFNFCKRFFQISSVFWFIAAMFLLFLLLYWLRFEILAGIKWKENICTVKLHFKGKTVETRALYDTGNHLVSPYTGEGVTVIAKDVAGMLDLEKEYFQLIPYHSIGGKGVLKMFRIDFIEMVGKGEKRENVLVAVSDTIKETAKIKVILNMI